MDLGAAADGGSPPLDTRFLSSSDQLIQALISTVTATTQDGDGPMRRRSIAMIITRLNFIFRRPRHLPTATGVAPASKEAIEALKDVDMDQHPESVICLDHQDAEAAGRWKEMPCDHRFHGRCLGKWLRVHGTCPMCRR
ncbi:hypothetical protein E2562_012311 [Oryza meyeriana var. granulata]|uniref:RING-type domain-containing protein n=1 Tax=Oryza meyeriana var. granulata TaxID=110450 RepID=A0A6G1DJB9_9ORYZ|nr:hypothetical protein E2562_012311 [Oryza meyeriana var. granulata]